MIEIRTGLTQRLWEEALTAGGNDERTALALLQGAFLENAIRLALVERPSAQQADAVHALCRTAADRLGDAAAFYARDAARFADAQEQGARFATSVRNRLELTRPPSVEDDGDTITELDAAYGDASDV